MSEINLVENTMTARGVRKARLLKMGSECTQMEWSQFVSDEVNLQGVAIHAWEEKGLGIWNTELSWMAREIVVVRVAGTSLRNSREAGVSRSAAGTLIEGEEQKGWESEGLAAMAWWWLGGMTISFGAEIAAQLFYRVMQIRPSIAFVQGLPKNGPKDAVIKVSYGRPGGVTLAPVRILEAAWAPWGFVVAGGCDEG